MNSNIYAFENNYKLIGGTEQIMLCLRASLNITPSNIKQIKSELTRIEMFGHNQKHEVHANINRALSNQITNSLVNNDEKINDSELQNIFFMCQCLINAGLNPMYQTQ